MLARLVWSSVHNERFTGEGFYWNRRVTAVATLCQGMSARQRDHHRFFQQRDSGESLLIGNGRPEKCSVYLFVSQTFDEFRAGTFLKRQGYPRVRFAIRANDTRYKGVIRASGRNANVDLALLASRRSPGRLKGLIKVRKHRLSALEKSAASLGQLNASPLAAKQLHIEFPLHRLNLPAQRRLLHVKPLRGPCHMPFFGNRNEISEVSQLRFDIQKV
jgi:hypothetical protein